MLQVPSAITKVTTMADKSLRLQVDTQELNPDASAEVFQYYNKYGVFVFSESEIRQQDIEVPEYQPIEKSDSYKSPSQRFRNVLYLLWKQKGQPDDFDIYYKKQMELIIDHFKGKLE